MIVFDRVPWPRPTILHRARRSSFGKKQYDDMITRLRLKQAYGRLVRRTNDRGVFVMLDPMTPSRMLGAFPSGVEVQSVGLAEAVAETRKFFSNHRIISAQACRATQAAGTLRRGRSPISIVRASANSPVLSPSPLKKPRSVASIFGRTSCNKHSPLFVRVN